MLMKTSDMKCVLRLAHFLVEKLDRIDLLPRDDEEKLFEKNKTTSYWSPASFVPD